MLERIGNKDILVQNYTSNFDIKQYINEVLMPKAFPNIPLNKLNLGFTGIMGELFSNAVEDVFSTSSLLMNEAFIPRSMLPSSIYSEGALFDLGYTFANPSKASFAIQIWIDDIVKYSSSVRNTPTKRYYLDRDTKLVVGDYSYRLDYDIIIDHQIIDGNRAFNIYYDIDETNSVSEIKNKHINHQVTSIGWLVLLVDLREYDRKIEENTVSDNLITTNSDIYLKWNNQIAGIDLTYVTAKGERLPLKKKLQYTKPEQDPFVWYAFHNDNTIRLMFSGSRGYFQPAFNSKIESTIYTCHGSEANFDSYDNKAAIPVIRSNKRYEYNANTSIVAICFSGSAGGTDKGDIELLRDDIIMAHNSVNVLSTDRDLALWFANFARRHGTRAEFFKRRDDPTGRLFSQYISIVDDTYVYPTNTLNIQVDHNQFDFVNLDEKSTAVDATHSRFNAKEFIIKPGHLWEYNGNSRDTVKMVKAVESNKMAMITDDVLPVVGEDSFLFTNPFYIKIHKDPSISANYNLMINHTSWPQDIPVQNESFYKFQLATFSIERTLSKRLSDVYKIQVICVPVITQTKIKYIEGIGHTFPVDNNKLRVVLITRSKADGETGYIEMIPIEKRSGGSILFQTYISVKDNLSNDKSIEIDRNKTIGIKPLLSNKICIDANETSFHFAIMMRDETAKGALFNDNTYRGYTMTNRFANDSRSLSIYKPMNMMRSVLKFEGSNPIYTVDTLTKELVYDKDKPVLQAGSGYKINCSLMPFIKWDIPLDEAKMSYFVRAFNEQYLAVEPVLKRLDGNSFLDFKLFNTYGKSNNYYIGPADNSDNLWDSNILLDSVHVKVKFRLAVYDRSAYLQTAEAVTNEIITYFNSLTPENRDVHVSDIIHLVKDNHPNVYYIRFCGFNSYDANKQSIFTKYDTTDDLNRNQLMQHTPELIRVDRSSIEIVEET